MVYIVGITATPRTYGNALLSLKLALRIAEMEGAKSVKLYNLYDYDIQPCIGCVSDNTMFCRYPCIFNDFIRNIIEDLNRCDGVIISTPIYWYNVPGPLKNFIDRITVLENAIFTEGRSRLEGKVVGFIAVGNDSGAIAVIQNLMVTFNSMGAIIPPWSLAYYESEGIALENEKFIVDVANVGRSVVLMSKLVKGDIHVDIWYRADAEFVSRVKRIAKEIIEETFSKL